MKKLFLFFGSILVGLSLISCSRLQFAQAGQIVKAGDKVYVAYTVKLDTGEQIDTRSENDPLVFTIDDRTMMTKFNDAIKGMKVGEEKSFVVSAQDAYGKYDPTQVKRLKKGEYSVAAGQDSKVGAEVEVTLKDGSKKQAKIINIIGEEVEFDFNHYLAGKDLFMTVKVVKAEAGNK